MRVSFRQAVLATLVAAACTSGGSAPQPPSPPSLVEARPGDGQALVTWNATSGATGYRVHYATSPGVTSADPSVVVAGTTAPVLGLANGTPYWFAVVAVNAGGAGPLSPAACAVPTNADQAGVALYDSLCNPGLSGSRWSFDGIRSFETRGGAAELHAEMDGMAPFAATGTTYGVTQSVQAGSRRVTTLRASVAVPQSTASTMGRRSQIRAGIRLLYRPVAELLPYAHPAQGTLAVEVGLVEQGTGLKAFRTVYHCDDPACASAPSTGIAFSDPAGWVDEGGLLVAPAECGASYTFEVRLAETEGTAGVFHWSVSGGEFGAGVSGAADPEGYLQGPAWTGFLLAGAGSSAFEAAQLRTLTLDASEGGGGSGRITARYDDVAVGFEGADAAPWDDFGATGGEGSPGELLSTRWWPGGRGGVETAGGALVLRHSGTCRDIATSGLHELRLPDPASIGTLQLDVRLASATQGPAASSSTNLMVQGFFYNDGTAGAAPGSAVGDIFASIFLLPDQDAAEYFVGRCTSAACSTPLEPVAVGAFPGARVGAGWHTIRLSWNRLGQRFTFSFDGNTVLVDPTSLAPIVGPANAPMRRIALLAAIPSLEGARASAVAHVNNVFVAP